MSVSEQPGVRKYAQKTNILNKLQVKPTLAVLFLAGLGLRLFFLKFRFAVSFDEVNYLKLGVSGYFEGISSVLHTYWSPLLPALISFFCSFFSDYELAARVVGVLAGAVLIFPVYRVAKSVFGQTAAFFAASFVAIFPPVAFQSTLILTEPLVMLFGMYAIFFGLKMLERYSTGYAMTAGLFSGLAYLAHPLGVALPALLVGWIILGQVSGWFFIKHLRLLYLLPALLLGFVIVAAPYLFFLRSETGTWTLSAKGAANQQMSMPLKGNENSFRALNQTNTSVPIDQVFHEGTFLAKTDGGNKPVRQVKVRPFLIKMAKNYSNILQRSIPQALTTLPLMLLGVGLFGAVWPAQKGKYILYLLSFPVAFWLVLIPAFHINLRYLTPMWPVCGVFIGQGFHTVYDWLRQFMPITKLTWKKKLDASSIAVLVILTVFILLSVLPEMSRVMARPADSAEYVADPVEQKAAGLWLREHVGGKLVIMSRNHAVDFYAGNYDIRESVTVPTNNLDRVLAYARHRKVTHMVLNERYLRDYPDLEFLIFEEPALEGMKLIYREVDKSGLRSVIYEMQ